MLPITDFQYLREAERPLVNRGSPAFKSTDDKKKKKNLVKKKQKSRREAPEQADKTDEGLYI